MDRLSDRSTSLLLKAARKVRVRLYFDRHDFRETVLLAGSGRSGTTWLMELLNFDDHYRSIFEPLHPLLMAERGFRPIQYLRPDNLDPAYMEPLAAVLAGRVRHQWTDKFNRQIFVKRRLIKCIHANLLLKWIRVNFPEIPIIFLLRHPCAVAWSRLKVGFLAPIGHFLAQEQLMEDYLAPFATILKDSTDPFDRHILMWCVENFVPLHQLDRADYSLVYYEHLVSRPEPELRRLCAVIGRPYKPAMQEFVSRPSALVKKHSAILTGRDLVEGWRQEVRPDQVRRANDLLASFGLDTLYGADGWPLGSD